MKKTVKASALLIILLLMIGLTACNTNAPQVELLFPIQDGEKALSNVTMNYNLEELKKQKADLGKYAYIYSDPIETDYKIIGNLGFEETDETSSESDKATGMRWFKKNGQLLRIDKYGSFTYSTGIKDTSFEMPLDEKECKQIAKEYLSKLGLLDEHISSQWSTNERSVTTDGIKTVIGIGVNMFVELDGKLVYGNNQISVDINGNGEVTAVNYSVAKYRNKYKVAVVDIDDAIKHIEEKQGLFNISDEAQALDFEKISLAYWNYQDENGIYLIPVYVFEGTEKTSDNNNDSFMIVVQADR